MKYNYAAYFRLLLLLMFFRINNLGLKSTGRGGFLTYPNLNHCKLLESKHIPYRNCSKLLKNPGLETRMMEGFIYSSEKFSGLNGDFSSENRAGFMDIFFFFFF